MKHILKTVINFLLFPMFLIGLLLPKSKNIWIFGSWFGDYYIDNSKYLFEYVDNNENAITPIWLTRNKLVLQYLRNEGKRCYYIKSFLGFYYTARSSVVIVSQGLVDINKLGVSNQIKVLLWHGSPIKKIAYDDRKNANPYNQLFFKVILKTWNIFFPFERENWDIITASSKEVKNKFKSLVVVQDFKDEIKKTKIFYNFLNKNKLNDVLIISDKTSKSKNVRSVSKKEEELSNSPRLRFLHKKGIDLNFDGSDDLVMVNRNGGLMSDIWSAESIPVANEKIQNIIINPDNGFVYLTSISFTG